MPTVNRMFRVIVAGGIALSATTPGLIAGCGGSVSTSSSDAGHGADGFPVEGVDASRLDAFPQETAQQPDAFPQETGQQVDAFPQEGPAFVDAGFDAFPQEGPNIEAGFFDAGEAGFPQETASP